jgi:hypothetical protein
MLDTGTATPGDFAWVDYFLTQNSPGYQGMLDTGTATRTSRGRVGCHTAICFLHFRHLLPGCSYHLRHSRGLSSLLLGGARTCAKPSDQSQNGSSSTVTRVWPGGSRIWMGVLTNHLGSITTLDLVHGF